MSHLAKNHSLENPTERLNGSVERVTFHSQEHGWGI